MGTAIEWATDVWNPTVGCSKVGSPACENCYAIDVAHRALQPAHAGLTVRRPGERPDWTGEVRLLPERLDMPARWKRPRRIFVDSMSDLFHPEVPSDFVCSVFEVMLNNPRHTFMVLTKRPQRMAKLLALNLPDLAASSPHIWLGTSIETDQYAFRADHLRATPAAVRFLSLEPLLGPLHGLDLRDIDWVIAGGESGPRARPMHQSWPGGLADRCAHARIPFFFKQWGEWAPVPKWTEGCSWVDRYTGGLHDRPTYDRHPVYRVGKKAAGRELYGRTWDELPEASA